jgi:hypothetical protein
MKLHTFALAFALALVITSLCASSIVWAQDASAPSASADAAAGRSLQIQTRGDAAARPRVTLQVIKTFCGTDGITWYQQADSGFRITCPLAQPVQGARQQRYTHLDFRYVATQPGGLAPVALAKPGCEAGTRVSVAGKAVLLRQGCGPETLPAAAPAGRKPPQDGATASLSTVNRGPVDKPWNPVFQTAPLPLPQDTAEVTPSLPGQAPRGGS